MNFILKLPKALYLTLLLIGAIVLDFIAFSFLSACPSCASFSDFITTQSALSTSIIASITTLFSLTGNRK